VVADPELLPRWWPGIVAVDAGRAALRAGARWRIRGADRPRFLRTPEPTGDLIVLAAEPPTHVSWQLTGDRVDVDLRLEEREPGHTDAVLTVEAPALVGLRRSLPRRALVRLRGLVTS
jgi:uncharacterized protein YndB with AHSA1/START domain